MTAKTESERTTADGRYGWAPRIRDINAYVAFIALVVALMAVGIVDRIIQINTTFIEVHRAYTECTEASANLQAASDLLTTQSRLFVATGDYANMRAYLDEMFVRNRRSKAVATLANHLEDSRAYGELMQANILSNSLSSREIVAMRLSAEARGMTGLPEEIARSQVDPQTARLDPQQKQQKAEAMLTDNEYARSKSAIGAKTTSCTSELLRELEREERVSKGELDTHLAYLRGIVFVLLGIVLFDMVANFVLVLRPMASYVERVREGRSLAAKGSAELRYLVTAYNAMYEEVHQRTQTLKWEAERDALTGLLNRGAYNRLMEGELENVALLVIDVDLFKHVNDAYGHEMGDRVLQYVARALLYAFRETDYACRVGGDEFAVIMTDVGVDQRSVVEKKIQILVGRLGEMPDDMPPVTLSIGVAFSDEVSGVDEVFVAADSALYEVKRKGRNGYGFYSDL